MEPGGPFQEPRVYGDSVILKFSWDFPGGAVVKESACQCRGHGFDPWSGSGATGSLRQNC